MDMDSEEKVSLTDTLKRVDRVRAQREAFQEPKYETPPRVAQVTEGIPLIPKGARILVTQSKFTQRSAIYIPDTAQVKPTTGRVVAIGPDVESGFCRLGEMVVFSLYAGIPLNIVNADGEEVRYLTLTPDEVAGELLVDPAALKTEEK